ncbi:MAG: tRNA preQ1(34) S-adenosylmethionine ribosyltransferase-isomerase QueA [Candidatus Zapsychrus exili]|nr:tRNA preQ1(34) S-adenosylmethionine ribosyltransferase-isomerase QueA [Candidatus Zapsychrus exili]
MLRLKDYDYHLPESLIAQESLRKRDSARLMVIDRKTQTIRHDVFSNLNKYLPESSIIVLNNSKVIPARLLAKRDTGGEVEIFLLKKLDDGYSYEVLMRPTKRLKEGEKIAIGSDGLIAEIADKEKRIVRFNRKNILKQIEKVGHIPLPPYIKRKDRASDRNYYQTVYAKKEGSVASPTAGLHFTNKLLSDLKKQGHKQKEVTLHINYATFKPVEEIDITKHKMHIEQYSISRNTLDSIVKTRKKGNKIVSVGTTATRVLETVAKNKKLDGSTDIFIYPGYKFKLVDALITNFHLPKSTLLMLVFAFGGEKLMKKAYACAIKEKYRFFSYGDVMVIL